MSDVLWKDLITIPERPTDGDFVHKLTEGVNDAEKTSSTYVVTRALQDPFNSAVGLVSQAIKSSESAAAFLHGSFGSGKSHFMAMLHLILSGHEVVTRRDEFFSIFEKYGEFRNGGRKVLNVHLHMLNAHTTESAIFSGYIQRVRELHPDAPLPDLLGLEPIVKNGIELRQSIGDDGFFATLSPPTAAGAVSRFGRANQEQGIAPSSRWDAARFDAAVAAGPSSDEYTALGRQLLRTVLTGMADLASRSTHSGDKSWVSVDQGLLAMSQHAKSLGYDAIVLFLDEHILWLAGLLGDAKRVSEEVQKLPKLVEANSGHRPIPIVSFVARQYELAEYRTNKNALYGSELAEINEQLFHHRTRLSTIRLPDSDLPQIVQKRLLEPAGADPKAARETIQRAYDLFLKQIESDDRTLITMGTVDAETMRMTWPFSPVLVQALVRLSEKLQRDRTALKLLTLLLCRHADDLVLGKVVPMGDLWLELSSGDEPMDQTSKDVFHRARRLYENKLRPALLERHNLVLDDLTRSQPDDDTRRALNAFRRDDLLVCTVLVASLLPDWEVTQNLDLQKLYAYNWGAVGGGRYAGMKLAVVKETMAYLAQRFDEVQLTPATDTRQADGVRLRLEGVDLEPILTEAKRYASKQRLEQETRNLIFKAMDLQTGGSSVLHKMNWRGGERRVTVLFENVRLVPEEKDDVFMNNGDDLKLVLDYPFDDPGFSSQVDLDRLEAFRQRHPSDCNTLVWLPRFLNTKGRRLLEDYVVTAAACEFFDTLTSNLDENNRKQARSLLDARRAQLREQTMILLAAAFGLLNKEFKDHLSEEHADVPLFNSLRHAQNIATPGVSDFGNALTRLAHAMLGAMFPGAPEKLRAAPLKSSERARLSECLVQGFSSGEMGFSIDKDQIALLKDVAQPLGMGELFEKELRFTIDTGFEAPLRQVQAQSPDRLTVQMLRDALDHPSARTGLPKELCDLMIVCWAMRNTMEFYDGTQRVDDIEARMASLPGTLKLLPTELPSEEVWKRALSNATQVLGLPTNAYPYRTPRNMRRLADSIRKRLSENDAVTTLPTTLASLAENLGILRANVHNSLRYRHAEQTAGLVNKIKHLNDLEMIKELGRAEVENAGVLKATFDKAQNFAAALADAEAMKDIMTVWSAREGSDTAAEISDQFMRQLLTGGAHEFSGAEVEQVQRRAKEWWRSQSISGQMPQPAVPDSKTMVDQALESGALTFDGHVYTVTGFLPDMQSLRNQPQEPAAVPAVPTQPVGDRAPAMPAPGVRRQRVRSTSELTTLLNALQQALASGRTLVVDWSLDDEAE